LISFEIPANSIKIENFIQFFIFFVFQEDVAETKPPKDASLEEADVEDLYSKYKVRKSEKIRKKLVVIIT
jgi:hypothetical protein